MPIWLNVLDTQLYIQRKCILVEFWEFSFIKAIGIIPGEGLGLSIIVAAYKL